MTAANAPLASVVPGRGHFEAGRETPPGGLDDRRSGPPIRRDLGQCARSAAGRTTARHVPGTAGPADCISAARVFYGPLASSVAVTPRACGKADTRGTQDDVRLLARKGGEMPIAWSPRRPHAASGWRMAALALVLVEVSAAQAHEFWIECSDFRPAVGSTVSLTLRIGRNLTGDSLPYIPAWTREFQVSAPEGIRRVQARIGDDPAAALTPRRAGTHVVFYVSTRDRVQMDTMTYEHYLDREGLRALAGRLGAAPGPDGRYKEAYYRFAKALLLAGSASVSKVRYDRVVGLEIELVAERNPFSLQPGQRLPMRLLYRGAPLADTLVNAYGEADPTRAVSARSDAHGRFALRLDHPGMWLVNAVHLRAAPSTDAARWHSLWASLTFHVAGRDD